MREEARRHGTREGTLRALSATGPVITSAGIILAGTFSVLMTLPVTFTLDLGFMVALSILLDTFVMRTIMVPASPSRTTQPAMTSHLPRRPATMAATRVKPPALLRGIPRRRAVGPEVPLVTLG
ncbi:MAG TPA: MMPL family transporter, partial [Vicinamibacteria bacterium]|nr:MMPL family transporter [Vicinamibacteria bacterium]